MCPLEAVVRQRALDGDAAIWMAMRPRLAAVGYGRALTVAGRIDSFISVDWRPFYSPGRAAPAREERNGHLSQLRVAEPRRFSILSLLRHRPR
jgi:hypothetical protein